MVSRLAQMVKYAKVFERDTSFNNNSKRNTMNILKALTAALVTAVISTPAIADNHVWKVDKIKEIGAVAYVESDRFSESSLLVYVETNKDCEMRLSVMTELTAEQAQSRHHVGEISARLKIDKNGIWTNDEARTFYGEDSDNLLFDNITPLDGKLFGEMLSGNSMIVQVGEEGTNKFSLTGFTKAVNKAVQFCESMPSEWDTEFTGDEWTS
jgi:hypothetical protein